MIFVKQVDTPPQREFDCLEVFPTLSSSALQARALVWHHWTFPVQSSLVLESIESILIIIHLWIKWIFGTSAEEVKRLVNPSEADHILP